MKVLTADIRFILPDDFQGSLADAIAEFVHFCDDPDAGLEEAPPSASYGTHWGALRWNHGLGLRAAVKASVQELADEVGARWQRVDGARPARFHEHDAAPGVWVK